ncbi:MAG: aminotransferase class III-fold pyridoxal phosphate-dependent enzyme [Candidatus Paceibacterota bacterium]
MKYYATYSRSQDCFPNNAPDTFISGKGCHVTATDGREFIDWGMALRAVLLGYCYPAVDDAAKKAIDKGVCFTRSNPYEGELREIITQELKLGEECKFGKNGSDATHAAVKLARAYTGRDIVLIAEENPFISTADFFIGTTPVNGGIPKNQRVGKYSYNDMFKKRCKISDTEKITELEYLTFVNNVAAIMLDPATVDVTKEKLQYIRDLCDKYGCMFILDETISGFRYDIRGVQGLYGIKPDLACYGKGMGNGYAVSCLAGRKELFDLGLRGKGNVFLLSGTYFSNTPDLAAAIATIREIKNENVIMHLNQTGRFLVNGISAAILKNNTQLSDGTYLSEHIKIKCHGKEGTGIIEGANPLISFSYMELKTLFDQCMIDQGILMPYIAPSFSHTLNDVAVTIEAAEIALTICRKAIDKGTAKDLLINGHCEKPVFRKV